MDNQAGNLSRIQEVINKSNSGVILIPPNPTVDAIAASTSLYLALSKIGKNVSLASSSKPQGDLVGTDKFQNTIGANGDSLLISFPYSDGSIDKVDYNIQGESFNLIISPRTGFQKLDPNKVKYSYTGGKVDFIIVIDTPTLNGLGQIYSDNQNQFIGLDIINIDRHLTNAYFGSINLVNKTVSSISELILQVLQNLKIEIDRDTATNLYSGIAASTNNFTSYSTNADTFENIATLLRLGAVKKTFKKPIVSSMSKMVPPSPQIVNPRPNAASSIESQPITPIDKVEIEKQDKQQQFEEKNPQDWLKPKIFKGSGLI